MPREILEGAQADVLLQRQLQLQAEATTVLTTIDLISLLTHVGRPVQVGSSVLGLMVWRDIDFNVLCDPLIAERAFEAIRPLVSHPRVAKLRYSNEAGVFRSPEAQDDGYYWGVRYVTATGETWKIDIWFVPHVLPRSEITLIQTLPPRLTPEKRLAILWIKDAWYRLPSYRNQVLSVDIYDAVLEHGVRTPANFDVYLKERGKPTRQTLSLPK